MNSKRYRQEKRRLMRSIRAIERKLKRQYTKLSPVEIHNGLRLHGVYCDKFVTLRELRKQGIKL